MKKVTLRAAFGVLACLATAVGSQGLKAREPDKPNIVFILGDDVGYGDLRSYGATLTKTPHLDRFAREGRRFTDAHSPASMCTPTRRAFLTGTYSWRAPEGSVILAGNSPLCISPGTFTIASMLKQAGYATGMIGKWHLGLGGKGGPDFNGEIKPGPLEIGFDSAFFIPATGDRVPCVYIENHRVVGLDPADPIEVSYREKIGDEPTGRENPELLRIKSILGHDGTIVNGIGRIGWMRGGKAARWVDQDMADTFARKSVEFIHRHREKPFFLYLATHDIHAPQDPDPRFQGSTPDDTRGAALAQLDDTVGKVLAALDEAGLTERTLVIFTSDNGGTPHDGYATGANPDHAVNGVLHGKKGEQFEGGHRVPFLARFPGTIPASSESAELISLTDLCATIAALLNLPLPQDAALDSLNVLPVLLGRAQERPVRETFISHGAGMKGPFGIRQGPWKLVQVAGGGIGFGKSANRPAQPPLLYNLADDLAEAKNLAKSHPEKVAELLQVLASERERGRTRLAEAWRND
jgi:arylsulfatase A-like enzyme